jgi:hypothetical protein
MPRRSTKKERGVFEKDPGSEIWWIRYYIDGRERREKVGRKKDASDLYKIRKADALRGVKLPNNMKSKGVKFEALGKHALEWYVEHGRKDVKSCHAHDQARRTVTNQSGNEQAESQARA